MTSKLERILKLILFFIFLLLFAYITISFFIDDLNGTSKVYENTICYDKLGNEIVGVICKKEIRCTYNPSIIFNLMEKCKNGQ